jgi:transcriptional regulator with XRE-family HTH domain
MNRDTELAKLFLECRLAAHLSQYQLADLMGVKQMSIHRWEHGICKPYKKNLNRLFSIYNEILKNEADDLSLLDEAQESEPQDTPESTNHVSQAVINKLRVIRKQLDHTDGSSNKEK